MKRKFVLVLEAASQQFKQPSITSTVALSTASLSTSTKKSDAMLEPSFHPQLFLKDTKLLDPLRDRYGNIP